MVDYPTQHDDFLMWVGFCITAWAKVEEHLFKICETCLRAREDRVAIVYYRTPTIDSRLKLVDELIRTALPKPARKRGGHDHPDLKVWNSLRKDIEGLLSTRSRIAHHPVRARGKTEDRPFWFLDETTWLEIYVSEAERLRTGREDTSPLTKDDLVYHCGEVHDVSKRAGEIWRSVLPKHVE